MHESRYPRANPWTRFATPNPGVTLRLFCFPYAGAGASVYRRWRARLPTWIHLCPIQLPGREERIREAPFTNMDALCAALLPALAPYLDMPVALFGHPWPPTALFTWALPAGLLAGGTWLALSARRRLGTPA